MSDGQVPDLQAILATLARYAPTNAAPAALPPQQNGGQEQSKPFDLAAHMNALANPPAPQPTIEKPRDPRLRQSEQPVVPKPAASPRPIDPSTITTWQEGLRCVTKLAAQNSQFVPTIKRLMREQKSHEMRWYSERQSLKQTQANRSTSANKANSILQSLNPNFVATKTAEPTESEKAAELATYDRKIYTAQVAMDASMSAELKALGVPFFGTDQSLIVPDGVDVSAKELPDDHPKWSPVITEAQLLELRRKLVGHLEDLYRD